MSSGSAFTSCVVIVVAVLVWIFYQKTKAAHRTKAALLSSRSHGIMWLSSSSEGLAECIPNTWSNLLAWLETSSAMCCWQKSIRPISQESDIQTSWGTVLLKQFQSPQSLHLLQRPCNRYIKDKEHQCYLQYCSKKKAYSEVDFSQWNKKYHYNFSHQPLILVLMEIYFSGSSTLAKSMVVIQLGVRTRCSNPKITCIHKVVVKQVNSMDSSSFDNVKKKNGTLTETF